MSDALRGRGGWRAWLGGLGARVTSFDDPPQNVETFAEYGKEGMVANDAQTCQSMRVFDVAGFFGTALFQTRSGSTRIW